MQGQPDPATLADKMAIQEQIRNYCRAVDRLDVPLGHGVFHDDSHADYGPAIYQGPGKGLIDAICRQHLDLISHSHQVTNVLIEVTGERAGSESYVFGTMRRRLDEGQIMHVGIWGRYLDAWEKRDGCWRILRRMVVFEHDERREVTPIGQDMRSSRDGEDPSYRFLTARQWGDQACQP